MRLLCRCPAGCFGCIKAYKGIILVLVLGLVISSLETPKKFLVETIVPGKKVPGKRKGLGLTTGP